MIEEFVSALATQMGMAPPKVSLVDGHHLGCIDVHLLNVSSKDHVVSALVFQSDIDTLKSGVECDRLKVKVGASLSRLQEMLEERNNQ
jgi:hypothetical protein